MSKWTPALLFIGIACLCGCKAQSDFYHAQYAELSEACRKSGGVPRGWVDEFGRPHLLSCEEFQDMKKVKP